MRRGPRKREGRVRRDAKTRGFVAAPRDAKRWMNSGKGVLRMRRVAMLTALTAPSSWSCGCGGASEYPPLLLAVVVAVAVESNALLRAPPIVTTERAYVADLTAITRIPAGAPLVQGVADGRPCPARQRRQPGARTASCSAGSRRRATRSSASPRTLLDHAVPPHVLDLLRALRRRRRRGQRGALSTRRRSRRSRRRAALHSLLVKPVQLDQTAE